ncbi:MAG: two-component regulator propeller domain-containing protein [Bacteroidota bacterium]
MSIRFIFSFLLVAHFFWMMPNSSWGQQFNFQNYSVYEGLGQSQVNAMIQDRLGYLWIGTEGGGVCRFDGKTFKQFTERNGLVNNYVEALFEDQDGLIWIGTREGFSKFDGKAFTNFTNEESNYITAFAQEPLGDFWVGTTKGTYRFDGEKFTDFKLESSAVHCFFYDFKGHLWIGTQASGAYQLRDGQLVNNFKIADGLATNDVRSILQDEEGNLYFGVFGGGVNVFNGSYFAYYRTIEGLSSNLVNTLFLEDDGKILVGTQDQGITEWNPQKQTFNYLTEADGLPSNSIRVILKDYWENYWFGTSGGGISKYAGQQFLHYTIRNGLVRNQVYALAKDAEENIWLSASSKGVSFFDGKKFTHYGSEAGFADTKCRAILVDDSDRVWLGTEGQGLALFDQDTFRFFTTQNGMGSNLVQDIIQDDAGSIWVATNGGGITRINISRKIISSPPLPDSLLKDSLPTLTYEDKLSFERFSSRNSALTSNRINALHLDKKNRIWFATRDNGIGFFKNNNKIFTISKKDGLPDNYVKSFAEDEDGILWIGTASKGICKIDLYGGDLSVRNFSTNPKIMLTSQNVYLLTLDQNQNLWVGSETGVDKIQFDQDRNPTALKHFGKTEGFLGIETCQNATIRDQQGNLWFGTMNGLTKYNPNSITSNQIPPILHVSAVELNYEPLSDTEYKDWVSPRGGLLSGLRLPWNKNSLEFEFQGINLSNPDKVLYQWKLEGEDDIWSRPRPRNFATFRNLAPKDYTLLLRAINEDGIPTESPLAVSFTILPAVWQTWWFKIVSVLLSFALITWIVRRRINSIRAKAAREKERLEMEKHLLSLEQKALQLQMNPHFIFNALNSIQSLISQKDNKKARYQLAKFSKLMRSILENSRSQTISLEDEIQTLQNYLAIEKSSRGNTFDFEITTLLEAETDELHIPPMMLQPFVENAIIHGVAHLHESGKIDIHFLQKNKILECSIKDNGIGRAKAKTIKSQIAHQHKSAALEVTQERLDILLKNNSSEKGLEIIDLKNEAGEAEGTEVIVRLPVEG